MIYLSICIPTYNRVEVLRNTISSITSQEEFTLGEVELVVSDNCSTDGTEVMVREFCSRFPNITYSQNSENLGANVNIHLALLLGTGLYRKLSNDTFEFLPGSIGGLLRIIKENQDKQSHLIFSNGKIASEEDEPLVLSGIDNFVERVSYEITWDGLIGFWDHEIADVVSHEDPTVWFWTITSILRILESGKTVKIYPKLLFAVKAPLKKDLSYGLIKVFYTAYLGCLKRYVERGLKSSTLRTEERKLIYVFFLDWLTRKHTSKKFVITEQDSVDALERAAGRRLPLFRVALFWNLTRAKARNFRKFVASRLHR